MGGGVREALARAQEMMELEQNKQGTSRYLQPTGILTGSCDLFITNFVQLSLCFTFCFGFG